MPVQFPLSSGAERTLTALERVISLLLEDVMSHAHVLLDVLRVHGFATHLTLTCWKAGSEVGGLQVTFQQCLKGILPVTDGALIILLFHMFSGFM
jgi:hypothetical protein